MRDAEYVLGTLWCIKRWMTSEITTTFKLLWLNGAIVSFCPVKDVLIIWQSCGQHKIPHFLYPSAPKIQLHFNSRSVNTLSDLPQNIWSCIYIMIFETTHYYLSFLFSHASLSPQHGKIKKMKYNKCQIIHICLFFLYWLQWIPALTLSFECYQTEVYAAFFCYCTELNAEVPC